LKGNNKKAHEKKCEKDDLGEVHRKSISSVAGGKKGRRKDSGKEEILYTGEAWEGQTNGDAYI